MYTIDNAQVAEGIESYSRTFRALIEFDDGSVVSGADIGTVDIEHIMSDDSTIPIGKIISKRTELKLYCNKKIRKGDTFRLYFYLLDFNNMIGAQRTTHRMLSQWQNRELSLLNHKQAAYKGITKDTDGSVLGGCFIPMGEFSAVKCVSEGLTAQTVTAYDKLAFSDKKYVPNISFPADAGAVTDDVLRQLGVLNRVITESGAFICKDDGAFICMGGGEFICSEEYTFTVSHIPRDATCREVLGYIAAMYGRNGVLDRHGAYTTIFIADDGIAYDTDKLDEPSLADQNVSVTGISCTVDADNVLTIGNTDSEYAVNITCPYMTAQRLNEIWSSLRLVTWRPSEANERLADPRRDIGDMMYYDNSVGRYSLPVTSLTLHFDGGLSADVSSCGQIEADEVGSLFIMTSSIEEMELLTIAELEERTIAELEG